MLDSGRTGAPDDWTLESEKALNEAVRQYTFAGRLADGLTLRMELRVANSSPFIRFRYILSSAVPCAMVSTGGRDITYLSYQRCPAAKQMEIRFSNYDSVIHGYCLNELPAFDYEDEVMGPILAEERASVSLLFAYEHGSMYPDKFIAFVREDGNLCIRSVKCNYPNGRSLQNRPYESVWL
ncbi:MAG: hypothetical protein IKS52_09275 [Clostridia bacterium]|nr:hypothetical protein [Clostridia bacterium]